MSVQALPPRFDISSAGPALLFVKADYCGHCTRAKPIIAQVAKTLGSVVPVFAVDSSRDKALIEALGVTSYPTIIYVNRGKLSKFNGTRDANTITGFVCSQASGTYAFCPRLI